MSSTERLGCKQVSFIFSCTYFEVLVLGCIEADFVFENLIKIHSAEMFKIYKLCTRLDRTSLKNSGNFFKGATIFLQFVFASCDVGQIRTFSHKFR